MPGALRSLRRTNENQLLELLRVHGSLYRAELARLSGLSRSTVSTLVADLIDRRLVVVAPEDGEAAGSGGRQYAERLIANATAGIALGIDFSYEHVRVALAGPTHELIARAEADLDAEAAWTEQLELALSLVESVLQRSGTSADQILGAGVGLYDPVDVNRGRVGASGRSLAWSGVEAGRELRDRLGFPISLDNTAHLASLAEVVWGAGRGARNAMYLKLSHGIGAGFLFDGRIFRGAIGAAGEIGHFSVEENGPVCACGNRGCLELYAGVPALLRSVRETHGPDITLPDVLTAALAGDRICRRVIADAGALLGRVVGGVCNLLNLDRIIVGGELAEAGELLLGPMRSALERHALPVVSACVQVVPAELGDLAGALGGVALVFREGDRLAHPIRPEVAHGHPTIDIKSAINQQPGARHATV